MAFELPEVLPDTVDGLDELEKQVRERWDEIKPAPGEVPSAEVLAELEDLANALDAIATKREELDGRAAAAVAVAEKFASFSTAPEPEGEAGVAEEVEPQPVEAEAEPEPAEPEPAEAEPEADEEPEPSEADDDDTEQEETNAKNVEDKDNKDMENTKFGGRTAGTSEPTTPRHGFRIDNAVPDRPAELVDAVGAARAFEAVAAGRAVVTNSVGVSTGVQFAHLDRHFAPELVAHDERSLPDVLDYAADESRLDGGSLVAAAGWCAPSETIYDFLPTTAATGLFSLPEITVARGGIRYPQEPDLSQLYQLDNFLWTEADAIAGTKTKQCVEIPCPEMTEVREDALWTCITSNLLQNRGWPELVAKFIAESMKAHLHRMSAYRVEKVAAGSTAVKFDTSSVIGAAGAVLNAVGLQASDLRLKHKVGGTIEAVAPSWLREIIRADLAYRDEVLPEEVPDAKIDRLFAERGVNVQFVDAWQNDVIGNATTPATKYPASVKVIMYPAGTWWSNVNPVVNLGATYDSAGLQKNQRTELFIEDGIGVGMRGYESRIVEVPFTVNGQVGLRAPLGGPAA